MSGDVIYNRYSMAEKKYPTKSISSSSIGPHLRRKPSVVRRKRRFQQNDQETLPTPPPDPFPGANNVFDESFTRKLTPGEHPDDKTKDIFNYLENRRTCGKNATKSALAIAARFSYTEEAFNHLEKLYTLIDQVLDFRDRNAKLFRRVRELERLKALGKAQRYVDQCYLRGYELILPDEDIGFAESLLGAMLQPTRGPEVARGRSFRSPPMRQRSRSIGIEHPATLLKRDDHLSSAQSIASKKRNSVIDGPKVSKWTKVKAAFKWERAGSGLELADTDITRYLRIPENTESSTTASGSSPRTTELSAPSTPATLSSSSSTDDVYHGTRISKRPHFDRVQTRLKEEDSNRRSRSLDSEMAIPQSLLLALNQNKGSINGRRMEKISKTPWDMFKDIIQLRRDSVQKQLLRNSLRSDDGCSISSFESTEMFQEVRLTDRVKPRVLITESAPINCTKLPSPKNEVVDLASRRLTPTLTITVPSSEELRSVSTPESISPYSHHLDSTEERSPSEDFDSPKSSSVSSISREIKKTKSSGKTDSPKGVFSRLQRQDSKWNKVKRAFLTTASSVPPSPSRVSSFFDVETDGGSCSASAEDLENEATSPTSLREIHKNYPLYPEKLGAEFYRKLAEWEKLKSTSPTGNPQDLQSMNRTSCPSAREKDSANALLLGDEQLTPEFKKKMQEWKRMKKGSSGLSSPEQQVLRRRLTDWQIWRSPSKTEAKTDNDSGKPQLSENFMKKLEEWKKIKANNFEEEHNKIVGRRDSCTITPQTNPNQRWTNLDPKQRWKTLDETEFQSLEKVLGLTNIHRQNTVKRRERAIDREQRLSKMKRVVDTVPQKSEVLVHTSTGFYRFEGISQEFTRKLYEWEKSQGIAPESSTFQLLNPAYKVNDCVKSADAVHEKGTLRVTLKRSKSVGSVADANLRGESSIRKHSCLSLNDAENLGVEGKSRIDSEQTIAEEEMSEEIAMDDSEPEAVIVDIEDVIEETASPMAKFQPQQTPVYCVTASETTSIAIPLGTVTASHEPSPVILIEAGETRSSARKQSRCSLYSMPVTNFEDFPCNNHQEHRDGIEIDPTNHNKIEIKNDTRMSKTCSGIKSTISENATDLDSVRKHAAEEAPDTQNKMMTISKAKEAIIPFEQTMKVEDLAEFNIDRARGGNYLTDIPADQVEITEVTVGRQPLEAFEVRHEMAVCVLDRVENHEDQPTEIDRKMLKNNESVQHTRISDYDENKYTPEDDVVITVGRDVRQKKVLKTRRLTDTQVGYKWRQTPSKHPNSETDETTHINMSDYPEPPTFERIIINERTLNKIVVPTAPNEPISQSNSSIESKKSQTSVIDSEVLKKSSKSESKSVFVKTKRMIFSPFIRRNSREKSTSTEPPKDSTNLQEIEETSSVSSSTPSTSINSANANSAPIQQWTNLQRSRSSSESPIFYERRRMAELESKRPPLPQSPILSRKEYRRSSPKETAPSIRMMIHRYNQKLQEDAGSPASSGSGSPIWRSPASERRVRTQMEKYQEEVRKAIAGPPRRDVQKSASAGVIGMDDSGETSKNTEISKNIPKGSPVIRDTAGFTPDDRIKIKYTKKTINENKNPLEISGDVRKIINKIETPILRDRIKQILEYEEDSDSMGKISPELVHKLNVLSNTTTREDIASAASNTSLTISSDSREVEEDALQNCSDDSRHSGVRALRLRKAKEDFLSRGPGCYSHDPTANLRYSTTSNASVDINLDLVKSASAGMINVDPRTYERLATKSCESSPVPAKSGSEFTGKLSQIASKFRRAKLKRGKEKDSKVKMNTVSMLCRQSLLVDIQGDGTSKSCPTSPSQQREDDDHRYKQHRDCN